MQPSQSTNNLCTKCGKELRFLCDAPPLVNRSNKTKLYSYGRSKHEIEMENFDLIAKVKELLNDHQLWGPDGTYTFKDGERWAYLEEHDETITD